MRQASRRLGRRDALGRTFSVGHVFTRGVRGSEKRILGEDLANLWQASSGAEGGGAGAEAPLPPQIHPNEHRFLHAAVN